MLARFFRVPLAPDLPRDCTPLICFISHFGITYLIIRSVDYFAYLRSPHFVFARHAARLNMYGGYRVEKCLRGASRVPRSLLPRDPTPLFPT